MTIDTSREAVEALMKGVTEGPWGFDCLEVIGPRRETVADPVTNKDGRFIAASRQLVPALLDRAEKAEEDLVYMAGQSMCESERANEAEAELAALKAEREMLRTAVRRANEMVPSISTPLMRGDNLATLLCSSFSEGGEEDDTGWDAAATAGYEEVIAAIRSHYAAALGDA